MLQLSPSSGSLVLVTKLGHLYALNIVRIGRSLQRLTLEKLAETTAPSCIASIGPDKFFIGTFAGTASLLIQYTTGPAFSAHVNHLVRQAPSWSLGWCLLPCYA